MHLYRTLAGFFVTSASNWHPVPGDDFDALLNREDLADHLRACIRDQAPVEPVPTSIWLAPLQTQEVWAAGVTYFRSRTARKRARTRVAALFTTVFMKPSGRRSFSKPPLSVWHGPVVACTCGQTPSGWCRSQS